MPTPTPPIGLVKTIGMWFYNLALAPGRIAKLAVAAEADRDPRPVCPGCGKGRVGNLQKLANDWSHDLGTCDGCGQRFHVACSTGGLNGIYSGD